MDVRKKIEIVLQKSHLVYENDAENDIYISEGLEIPFWISVGSDEGFIKIFSYVDVRFGADMIFVNNLVNEVNFHWRPNSLSYNNGKLWSFYHVPVQNYWIDLKFIELIMFCAESFMLAIKELDMQKVIL